MFVGHVELIKAHVRIIYFENTTIIKEMNMLVTVL
jgi:hypothetical protein